MNRGHWLSLRRFRQPRPIPGRSDKPASYVRDPRRLRKGHALQLLRGGAETFPAMLAAIAAARRWVHLETYILRSDGTGERFLQALVARSRAGVEVRLIYDAIGSLGTLEPGYLERLAAAGVQVLEFHPLAPWRRAWGLNRRDHQKILVVDGRVGFTGGINVGDEYLPEEQGGRGWHDLHVRVEGPVVAELARTFRRAWVRGGGGLLDMLRHSDQAYDRAARAVSNRLSIALVDNFHLRGRWTMHAAYRFAIGRARQTISITNAYFIPDARLRRAFRHAVRRGVAVGVIVPAVSDVPIVLHASRHLYKRLLRDGVRLFEYRDHMMHAKAGVVDGLWATIGSYNLDKRSFFHNLEVGLVIADERAAGVLQAQFQQDLAQCREVTRQEVESWGIWKRALHWVCFRFRYWL